MAHTFHKSQLNIGECIVCKRTEDNHICEICGTGGFLDLFCGMLCCEPCIEKEKILQAELKASEPARLAAIESSRIPAPDATIQITSDIFNAKIASINQLRVAIEASATIENKHFALAEMLDNRYKLLKNVITEASATIKDAQNEQRAIQSYWNELSKKLRADEREKIKIADVQYHPPEKPTKKVKAPTVKNFDKATIRTAAENSGINEMLITLTCVQRNVTPLEAVRILREAGVK